MIGWSEIQNARPQTAPSLGKLQGAPLEDFQQLFIPLWRDVLFEAARRKWLFGFRFDFRERYGAVPVIFIGKYLPGFRVRDSDALLGIHSECLHRSGISHSQAAISSLLTGLAVGVSIRQPCLS